MNLVCRGIDHFSGLRDFIQPEFLWKISQNGAESDSNKVSNEARVAAPCQIIGLVTGDTINISKELMSNPLLSSTLDKKEE